MKVRRTGPIRRAREGFTLVEILIVIVIIGILTSGMLLSGTGAVSSARALNIVSDLRIMKEAVLMMYIDSMDQFDAGTVTFGEGLTPGVVLARYLDNPEKFDDHYKFAASGGRWYVSYTVKDSDPGAGDVRASLTGRASSAGLLKAVGGGTYDGGPTVYMLAR